MLIGGVIVGAEIMKDIGIVWAGSTIASAVASAAVVTTGAIIGE